MRGDPGGGGLAELVALGEIASPLAQGSGFRDFLDAFCDNVDIQLVADVDHALDQRGAAHLDQAAAANEALVQFQSVNFEFGEVAKR